MRKNLTFEIFSTLITKKMHLNFFPYSKIFVFCFFHDTALLRKIQTDKKLEKKYRENNKTYYIMPSSSIRINIFQLNLCKFSYPECNLYFKLRKCLQLFGLHFFQFFCSEKGTKSFMLPIQFFLFDGESVLNYVCWDCSVEKDLWGYR